MPNKKRNLSTHHKSLGKFHVCLHDLLVLESLLLTYADARELKHAGLKEMPRGIEHMPIAIVDRYVALGQLRLPTISIGRNFIGCSSLGVDFDYKIDTISILQSYNRPKYTRYIRLGVWPGIHISFTPFKTVIHAQTNYATGKELMVMRKVINDVEDYISSLKPALINKVEI